MPKATSSDATGREASYRILSVHAIFSKLVCVQLFGITSGNTLDSASCLTLLNERYDSAIQVQGQQPPPNVLRLARPLNLCGPLLLNTESFFSTGSPANTMWLAIFLSAYYDHTSAEQPSTIWKYMCSKTRTLNLSSSLSRTPSAVPIFTPVFSSHLFRPPLSPI